MSVCESEKFRRKDNWIDDKFYFIKLEKDQQRPSLLWTWRRLIQVTESGLINTFKLVHRSGSFKCRNKASCPASYWDCAQVEDKLITLITLKNGTALLLAEYGRYGQGCNYYSYNINGVGVDSPELTFNNLPSPIPVTVGQEFHIWTARDMIDCGEDSYSSEPGRTCADVYEGMLEFRSSAQRWPLENFLMIQFHTYN